MIITDGTHLVSDSSEDELHIFAKEKLAFKPEWYQVPKSRPANSHEHWHRHYDLTTPKAVTRALAAGAQKVTGFELLRRAWWSDYKWRQRNGN